MSLLDYIRGRRKGESAHRLEKEAMHDPFLQEAIDGFDSVDDDHLARIAAIRKTIGCGEMAGNTKKYPLWKVMAAASIFLLFVIGTQLLMKMSRGDMGLQSQAMVQLPIDIYVPDDFYKENIAIIAYNNTESTKNVSVVTDKHRGKGDSEDIIVAEETKHVDPIDVYIPN